MDTEAAYISTAAVATVDALTWWSRIKRDNTQYIVMKGRENHSYIGE